MQDKHAHEETDWGTPGQRGSATWKNEIQRYQGHKEDLGE